MRTVMATWNTVAQENSEAEWRRTMGELHTGYLRVNTEYSGGCDESHLIFIFKRSSLPLWRRFWKYFSGTALENICYGIFTCFPWSAVAKESAVSIDYCGTQVHSLPHIVCRLVECSHTDTQSP